MTRPMSCEQCLTQITLDIARGVEDEQAADDTDARLHESGASNADRDEQQAVPIETFREHVDRALDQLGHEVAQEIRERERDHTGGKVRTVWLHPAVERAYHLLMVGVRIKPCSCVASTTAVTVPATTTAPTAAHSHHFL